MDWMAAILGFLANWEIGKFHRIGWLYKIIGTAIGIYLGISAYQYGLAVLSFIAMIVAIKNFFSWSDK